MVNMRGYDGGSVSCNFMGSVSFCGFLVAFSGFNVFRYLD